METKILEALRKAIPSSIALPGDEIYESASSFFKRTLAPGVVIRPSSSKEMAIAVRLVNEHGLPLAIKSGGHSNIVYNLKDGGALIDLSALKSIRVVDAENGLVEIGTGALGGEVADELDRYDLAIASGDSRVVGIGGLATGGGLGFLVRKYGALVDDIVAAEVVTADGRVLTADKNTNADLLWAVRGGGSNFGIVTHVTIQAHPVGSVFETKIRYPLDDAKHIIKGWRDAMRSAPDELTTILTIIPKKAETPGSILIHGCFTGDDETYARDGIKPLLTLGEPSEHSLQSKRYKDLLEDMSFRATSKLSIARNMFVETISDEFIDTIIHLANRNVLPVIQIRHTAGAMNQQSADLTAFSHRESEALIFYSTSVEFDATDQEMSSALEAWRSIEPFSSGCYINMSSEATESEIARAFPPDTLKRLRKIKTQYDPENHFNTNYNILPTSDTGK
jgi:hypothetical protein